MAAVNPPSPSPLPRLLLLFSTTTGLVDAVSVLGLGKVFTANMTGNIVFLGFAVVGTPGFMIAPYILALAAFIFGALVGGRLGRKYGEAPLRNWLVWAALFETFLLWLSAAIAFGIEVVAQTPQWRVSAIVVLTAIAMGSRNATVRQLKVPDLTTTVLTLTITGIAADSHLLGGAAPNLGRRLGAVAAIFVGAAIGAALVVRFGLTPPLMLAGGIVLLVTLAFARHPASAQPHRV
jgi:uncharacterized membrane protein YoaK (UPF0700 family)